MPMRLNEKRAAKLRGRQEFLLCQLLHLAILGFYMDGVSAIALFVSGVVNVILYGRLLWNEFSLGEPPLHPFLLFLASGMMRVGVATCWAAAAYGLGHTQALMFGPVRVEGFLMYGQACMMAGDWLFILGFTVCSSRAPSVAATSPHAASTRLTNLAIGLLLFGWGIKALIIADVPLWILGHIIGVFASFATAAAIYLFFVNARATQKESGSGYYWLLAAVIMVEGVISLSSYMKSDTLILIIGLGLCGAHEAFERRARGRKILSPLQWCCAVAILIFVVFVLFPYSQIRRSEFWVGQRVLNDVEIWPYLGRATAAAIPGTEEFSVMHEFPSSGAWSFLARHADVTAAAWCHKYVTENGDVRGMFLWDSLVNMVPRLVWKDKPLYYPGRKISVMTGFSRNVESATTSTGVGGIAPSLYLNLSVYGLIIGCFLNGVMFSIVSGIFLKHALLNPIATVLFVAVCHAAITHFESVLDGALVTYVYWLVAFVPLLYFSKLCFGKSERNSHKLLASRNPSYGAHLPPRVVK